MTNEYQSPTPSLPHDYSRAEYGEGCLVLLSVQVQLSQSKFQSLPKECSLLCLGPLYLLLAHLYLHECMFVWVGGCRREVRKEGRKEGHKNGWGSE